MPELLYTNCILAKKKRSSTSGGNKPCKRPKPSNCKSTEGKSKKKKPSKSGSKSKSKKGVSSKKKKLSTKGKKRGKSKKQKPSKSGSKSKSKKGGSSKKKKPKKKASDVDPTKSWVTLSDPSSVQYFPSLLNKHVVLKKRKTIQGKSTTLNNGENSKAKEQHTNLNKYNKPKDSSKSWVTLEDPMLHLPLSLNNQTTPSNGQRILREEYGVWNKAKEFPSKVKINHFKKANQSSHSEKVIPADLNKSWVTLEGSVTVQFPSMSTEYDSMLLDGKGKGKKKKNKDTKKKKGKSKGKSKKKSKGKSKKKSKGKSKKKSKGKSKKKDKGKSKGKSMTGVSKKDKKKKKKQSGKGKCKKIPFPGCTKKKQKKEKGKCPKPTKKKKVKDCPPSKKCAPTPISPFLHLLSGEKIENECPFVYLLGKRKKDKGGQECPKVDLTTCEDKKKKEDPCGMKRKGVTKNCPTDLLVKKRRKPQKPKKKTSNITSVTSTQESLNFNTRIPTL